jgi:membrane protease YdiL (CAAX protease family)
LASEAMGPTQSQSVRTGLMTRVVLVVFCLASALAYRTSVSLISSELAEDVFVLGLSAVLLALSLGARRSASMCSYWQIPYAFFVFTLAGFFGDGTISPLQHGFVNNVLREKTTSNNPLASTVTGMVLAQLVGTLLLVVPIIVLTRVAGQDLRSIFIARPQGWWGFAAAVVVFIAIYFLAARGRTESFFPTNGEVSFSRLLSFTPALVALVLLNGVREEMWFRALFLNKYGVFLRPLMSNALAAVIFTSFHVQVQYSASIVVFLAYTLILGLILGWLMQRTKSFLPSAIFHAATDIPIFVVYLSYAST